MEDFRVKSSFTTSRKRRYLQAELGSDAVLALVDLWAYCAREKPSGSLYGLSDTDIEMEAYWRGEPRRLVDALVRYGLLDGQAGDRSIHDWSHHNPYVATHDIRVESARAAGKASAEARAKKRHAHKDAQSSTEFNDPLNGCQRPVERMSTTRSTEFNEPSTPSPSPSPFPDPNHDIEREAPSIGESPIEHVAPGHGSTPEPVAELQHVAISHPLARGESCAASRSETTPTAETPHKAHPGENPEPLDNPGPLALAVGGDAPVVQVSALVTAAALDATPLTLSDMQAIVASPPWGWQVMWPPTALAILRPLAPVPRDLFESALAVAVGAGAPNALYLAKVIRTAMQQATCGAQQSNGSGPRRRAKTDDSISREIEFALRSNDGGVPS